MEVADCPLKASTSSMVTICESDTLPKFEAMMIALKQYHKWKKCIANID